MTLSARSGWFNRAPMGLLGMILLTSLVEHGFSSHSDDFTELMPATWKYSATMAKREAPRSRILCFGSSLVKFGVVPKALEAESGEPGFNLAVYSGRMASSYLLLKKSLESGARPRAILLDCHDGPIAANLKDERSEALITNQRNWPELADYRDCLELAIQAHDAQFLASTAVARALPSVRERDEIRSILMKAFSGQSIAFNQNIVAAFRNWNMNRGTQVMAPIAVAENDPPTAADEIDHSAVHEIKAGNWKDNPFMEECFKKVLRLARAEHIQVFLLLPPLSPRIQSGQDEQGQTYFYDRLAKRALHYQPGLVVLDGRRSGYGIEQFRDRTHLNAIGALAMSRDIGRIMAKTLKGETEDPWVMLPKFQQWQGPDPSESFEQSRVAIGFDSTAHR